MESDNIKKKRGGCLWLDEIKLDECGKDFVLASKRMHERSFANLKKGRYLCE